MNKRYFVIATVWSDEYKEQIKVIAGEFNNYINASIFKEAYNDHYSADAYIVDEYTIANR